MNFGESQGTVNVLKVWRMTTIEPAASEPSQLIVSQGLLPLRINA